MEKIITIQVKTRSRQALIVQDYKNQLIARLTAPPVDGKANTQLIELLADYFKVAKSKVEIISGLTSKIKRVRIQYS